MPVVLETDDDLRPSIAVEPTGSLEKSQMQRETLENDIDGIIEIAGDEHRDRIIKMIYMKSARKRKSLFESNYAYIEQTDGNGVEIKYYPSGIDRTSSVIAGVGEDIGDALLMLITSIASAKPDLLHGLEDVICSPQYGTEEDISDGLSHGLTVDNIQQFSDELDEREEEREEESLTHEIEVQHNADDFEADLDFETQMYQLAKQSDADDDVARVTNYVHKSSTDSVVLLVELPDQSRGRAVYDVPDSVDDPLVDVLDAAVSEDRNEDISLKNIERIAGSLIPVVGDGDVWAVDVEKNLNMGISSYTTDVESDSTEYELEPESTPWYYDHKMVYVLVLAGYTAFLWTIGLNAA